MPKKSYKCAMKERFISKDVCSHLKKYKAYISLRGVEHVTQFINVVLVYKQITFI